MSKIKKQQSFIVYKGSIGNQKPVLKTYKPQTKPTSNLAEGKSRKNPFNYQMLSRMKSDLDYFLGNANRHPGHLYFKDSKQHLKEMKGGEINAVLQINKKYRIN